MIGCLIGALLAITLNVLVPGWLGYKGYSPLWLLLLAVVVFPTLGRTNQTINSLWAAGRQRRMIRGIYFFLVLPIILCAAVDLIPYIAGRVIARRY